MRYCVDNDYEDNDEGSKRSENISGSNGDTEVSLQVHHWCPDWFTEVNM